VGRVTFDVVVRWKCRSPTAPLVVGVILYVLMVGDLPYSVELTKNTDFECLSPKSKQAHKNMCELEIDWDEEPWPMFPEARDLCQSLLHVSPMCRVQSAEAALAHPFLQHRSKSGGC